MYQRVLMPVDGSETSNRGLDEAIQLARLTGGRIRLVHGIDSLIFSTGLDLASDDLVGVLVDAGAQILCEANARVEARGLAVDAYFPETLGGRICDMVVEQASSGTPSSSSSAPTGGAASAASSWAAMPSRSSAQHPCRYCWFDRRK